MDQIQSLPTPSMATTPIPSQPSKASIPPLTPQSNRRPLIVTIILLTLITLTTSGYFVYQILPSTRITKAIQDCLSKGGSPTGESIPPHCYFPTPSSNPTTNWRTYKYQQLFDIKIPNDLKIIDNGRIEIGDYLSIGTYPTSPEDCRGDCSIIETKVSKTINGLEVRYLTGWWGEIGGNIAQSYIEYLIPHNEKYIYLQMQELPFSTRISLVREKVGKVSEVNSKLLDQILSTFKFAEQTTLVPPDFQTQVSGARCAPVSTESIVTITIPMENVPQPRCVHVTSNQKLKIVNQSQGSISINVGEIQTSLVPTQSFQFPKTMGEFLAPGGHSIAGAEIFLE